VQPRQPAITLTQRRYFQLNVFTESGARPSIYFAAAMSNPAPDTLQLPPTHADVRAAALRIASHAHRTPVLRSRSLDALSGAWIVFKCENLQRAGAFKFRGACNAVWSLDDDTARLGVVTHSSGNHWRRARARGFHARHRGARGGAGERGAREARRDRALRRAPALLCPDHGGARNRGGAPASSRPVPNSCTRSPTRA
jgi:hypothetical protein